MFLFLLLLFEGGLLELHSLFLLLFLSLFFCCLHFSYLFLLFLKLFLVFLSLLFGLDHEAFALPFCKACLMHNSELPYIRRFFEHLQFLLDFLLLLFLLGDLLFLLGYVVLHFLEVYGNDAVVSTARRLGDQAFG